MTALPSTTRKNSVDAQLDRMPVGRVHRRIIVAIGLGLFFDMYEIFLAGSMTIALGKDFQMSGTEIALVVASSFIGMFVGSSVIGSLSDRIGRRKAFIFTLIWYSVWSLIGAFSPSAWFLIGTRFLAGVGLGAETPISDTYLSDVLPRAKRGRLAGWAFTFSYVAVPIVGFLALWLNATNPGGISGWRYLLAIGGLGALAVLYMRRNLPKSPRWLASVGRLKEAHAALAVFAAGSGVQVEPVEAADASSPASTRRLRDSPYAKRVLMLSVFHLFQGWGYYGFGTLSGLVLVASGHTVTQSLFYVAVSFIGYPVGSLISVPLMKLERKYLLIGATLGMAGCGLLFTTSTMPVLIVIFGFLTTVMSNIFSNTYRVYQAEIFPTELRGTAVGRTYSLSRLSNASLPFILIPLLHNFGAGLMFSVVAVALVMIATFVLVIGPRSSGRALTDINP